MVCLEPVADTVGQLRFAIQCKWHPQAKLEFVFDQKQTKLLLLLLLFYTLSLTINKLKLTHTFQSIQCNYYNNKLFAEYTSPFCAISFIEQFGSSGGNCGHKGECKVRNLNVELGASGSRNVVAKLKSLILKPFTGSEF